jgi:histone deacetylase complex regulatory component SIN3
MMYTNPMFLFRRSGAVVVEREEGFQPRPTMISSSSDRHQLEGITNQENEHMDEGVDACRLLRAMEYTQTVARRFELQPHIVSSFTKILQDYQHQILDRETTTECIRQLFMDHTDLIVDYEQFLPPLEQTPKVVVPSATTSTQAPAPEPVLLRPLAIEVVEQNRRSIEATRRNKLHRATETNPTHKCCNSCLEVLYSHSFSFRSDRRHFSYSRLNHFIVLRSLLLGQNA